MFQHPCLEVEFLLKLQLYSCDLATKFILQICLISWQNVVKANKQFPVMKRGDCEIDKCLIIYLVMPEKYCAERKRKIIFEV